MTTIGKISEIPFEPERNFQWEIENFASIPAVENEFYRSALFSFAGASWNLKIYPNGHEDRNSIGYIDLYLHKKSSAQPISLEYSLIIKAVDEKENIVYHFPSTFEKNARGKGKSKIFQRSEFLKKSEFLPNNILTIVCMLKLTASENASNVPTTKCSYCKKTPVVEVISSHEKRCLDKPIKCPECGDITKLRSWYEHVCQMEKEKVIGKMLNYFKDIMVSGEYSDTIIQVREVEFRVHRIILAARNPFFIAMFKNEMKEKATGVVSVNDCEPDIFRLFLHFLYTGKVEDMSQENVCSLYEIADKYQDDQLKEKCLNFIESSISVESFCEYIILALEFNEKKLLEKVIEFFISRGKDIVRHVKWSSFMKEYPTQANELFIKSFDHYME